METLYNIIIFSPFVVTLCWSVMGLLKWKKSFRTWMSNLMLIVASFYLYGSSGFIAHPTDYSALPVYDVLCWFSGVALMPCIWAYLLSLKGLRLNNFWRTLFPIFVITNTVVSAILYYMLGPEESALYFQSRFEGTPFYPSNPGLITLLKNIGIYFYRVVILAEFVVFMSHIVWNAGGPLNIAKAFKNYYVDRIPVPFYVCQMITVLELLVVIILRATFFEVYLIQHMFLTILIYIAMTVMSCIICYKTLFNDVKELSLDDFFSPVIYGSALEDIDEVVAPVEEPVLSVSDIVFGVRVNKDSNVSFTPLPDDVLIPLQKSFDEYFNQGEAFLEKGITLVKIAEDIKSNKSYVSKVVSMTYGMTFPEYLNKKRIEYAKSVLLNEPDIKQEVLAEQCGFANASAFNRAFKRETDQTPRMWCLQQKMR